MELDEGKVIATLEAIGVPVCKEGMLREYLLSVGDPHEDQEGDRRLALSAQGGDEKARGELVSRHLGLAISVSREYSDYGAPFSRSVNFGAYALAKAALKFNPERGYKFGTYAVWWIRTFSWNSMLQFWGTRLKAIRHPVNWKSLRQRLLDGESSCQAEIVAGGRLLATEVLKDKPGFDVSALDEVLQSAIGEYSDSVVEFEVARELSYPLHVYLIRVIFRFAGDLDESELRGQSQ